MLVGMLGLLKYRRQSLLPAPMELAQTDIFGGKENHIDASMMVCLLWAIKLQAESASYTC